MIYCAPVQITLTFLGTYERVAFALLMETLCIVLFYFSLSLFVFLLFY